jgi:hypothetical protein
MSFFGSKEFYLEVKKGNVAGYTIINKFGRSTAIPTTVQDVWDVNALYSWPTTASPLEAISDSVNDTAAGSGARQVYVNGLDGSFNEKTELIDMAGTSASTATLNSFFRVNRAWVATAGTYAATATTGSNDGIITIRRSGAGSTQAQIVDSSIGDLAAGQSQLARYSVAAGFTAYIIDAEIFSNASKSMNAYLLQRQSFDDTAAPVASRRLVRSYVGLAGGVQVQPILPLGPFPEKTDIFWLARAGTGSTNDISIAFNIMVIED